MFTAINHEESISGRRKWSENQAWTQNRNRFSGEAVKSTLLEHLFGVRAATPLQRVANSRMCVGEVGADLSAPSICGPRDAGTRALSGVSEDTKIIYSLNHFRYYFCYIKSGNRGSEKLFII